MPNSDSELPTSTFSHPPIRGTQSFVQTMTHCWRRPSLLLLELRWRWGFGIPALLLLFYEAQRIYNSVSLASTGIYQFSLQDPLIAAQTLASVLAVLLPPVRAVALWLLPLLILTWAIASGFGRMAVLRRYDRTLRSAPWMMVGIQLLRILTLGGSFAVWFLSLHWAARTSLGGDDPNMVGYFVKAIVLSLALFTLWAISSWVFSAAPLIALLEKKSMLMSLGTAAWLGPRALGPLRGKLVEINLVLGIIKLCLVVLAMVFSATLLPFQSELDPWMFYTWWVFISILYLVASDFFQVTRLVAFIDLWRVMRVKS